MTNNPAAIVQAVTGNDPATIEANLNLAVEIAQGHAIREGSRGVLVTQHGFTSYTVTVTADVPFGQTQERRMADRGVVSPALH
jgi:hypothetical protein